MVALMYVLFSMPGLMDSVFSVDESSSEISVLESSILQTDISVDSLVGTVGVPLITFNLNNVGTEKLWDYDNFEIFITYDADIAGIKTPITEKSSFGHLTDFKIQRGTFIMPVDELTVSISSGTDFSECTGACFIKHVSTRHSSNGQTVDGYEASAGHNDFSTYIENDGGLQGGDVDFTRHGTRLDDYDNRVHWEIWEYIGDPGGPNQMVVLDTSTCDFAGVDLTCTGTQTPSSATDDTDVVVFITGIASENTGRNEMTAMLVTSEWVGTPTNNPVFTRDDNNGLPLIHVSYAVVEFTGSNWSVHREEHTGTGGSPSTELIPDVGDITRAFFHHQQRNVDTPPGTEGLCESGEEVRLTASDTLTYTHPWGSAYGAKMTEVTWVMSNTNTIPGQTMIVEHLNPPFRGTGATGGDQFEDNWQVTITPVIYGMDNTAITGLTTQSNGCGTAFPRGFIAATLLDSSTVDLYQTSDGQNQEYAFQITQFPRVTSQWEISNILNDILDPDIINSDETAQITASLTYPIFSGGTVAIVVSTDKGVTSTNAIIVT